MRFLRPGWIAIYIVILFLVFRIFTHQSLYVHDNIYVEKGSSISALYDSLDLGYIGKIKLKLFLKRHSDKTKNIHPGVYVFSGEYDFNSFLDVFLQGPQVVYESIRVLEGRNIYDVDMLLQEKGLIVGGEYVNFVRNEDIIRRYINRYEFLRISVNEDNNFLESLEGYLYPDTYYIDKTKNVIDQLVYLQLEAFYKKIRIPYKNDILQFNARLRKLGFDFTLSYYEMIVLASIIEKEERRVGNKKIIASIFLNRIQDRMRIDADITLCYGLGKGYRQCTESVIVQHLYDNENPYNTRSVFGLPPTPISNIQKESLLALLYAERTPYYFYLHDRDGNLHVGKNAQEHKNNKRKYLQK